MKFMIPLTSLSQNQRLLRIGGYLTASAHHKCEEKSQGKCLPRELVQPFSLVFGELLLRNLPHKEENNCLIFDIVLMTM